MKNFTEQLFGGSWTEKKLEILKKYLDAYNTALKKQPFLRVYIDAFAGTGYRQQQKRQYNIQGIFEELEQEESKNFLKGSAKLALEARPSFHRYIFIESDKNKIDELEKLQKEHPEKAHKIEIEQSDANEFIQNYCDNEDWTNTRAVLFLDPFATEVEWPTIEAVAKTQCIDVWILFPLMAVNRLLAKDPKKISYDRLNRIFGIEDWFENFYKTRTLDDIFGQPVDIIIKACNFDRIGNFYKNRLRTIFSGVAENTKVFYNSRRSALFQLFFAVGNTKGAPIAIRIAEHLMRNI
ncbi:MAG TPA: three-Cys-motif partner protein TcmP [Planctomycetes bacterium]|nr:three-Cys-motif partner protein TcmP [Planctomycetota bacterium]